jgi:hypothetical protein
MHQEKNMTKQQYLKMKFSPKNAEFLASLDSSIRNSAPAPKPKSKLQQALDEAQR